MMEQRSGIKLIKWSLFVDTDSLYRHTRQLFGSSARVDYLQLPKKIIENTHDIPFFQEKVALTMRLGKDWSIFSESLASFGYDIIPADRGMQPVMIAAKVKSLLASCNGVVIVTSSDKIIPLAVQISEAGGFVKMVSFSKDLFGDESERYPLELVLMDKDWLWFKDSNEHR